MVTLALAPKPHQKLRRIGGTALLKPRGKPCHRRWPFAEQEREKEPELRHDPEPLLQRDPEFQPGQVRPQAPVRPRAEREVAVTAAVDPEIKKNL